MLPFNFHPRKRFGQSFLIDKNIIRKIVKTSSLSCEDIVLEIGPGQGILTEVLASQVKKVIAVELDKKLYEYLKTYLKDSDNIELINKDILKFNLTEFIRKLKINKRISLIGNIPYSITTPILEYIFRNLDLLNCVYLMVQREFAFRLAAKPNTNNYSSISCFAQFYTDPSILFSVNRTCFRPIPKVDSCFIKLEPKKPDYWSGELRPKNEKLLFEVIHAAFNQRRKSISNSLACAIDKNKLNQILKVLSIDWHLRAENLSVSDYIKISNQI